MRGYPEIRHGKHLAGPENQTEKISVRERWHFLVS